MRRLRVLTWHVHGNYLWYLSQAPHDFFLPVGHPTTTGYGGRGHVFPFGGNVHDVPADQVREQQFDLVLYQHEDNWLRHRHALLSERQRRLPRVFLQHDPPLDHPTGQRHCFDDALGLLVHVTPFNALMWDNGVAPVRVVEHGVPCHAAAYTGELARGLVVINDLATRGRRLGGDIFLAARDEVPLDLVGLDAGRLGGLPAVAPLELAPFSARYRFFFNPIRWTSLGLAVCEAMMVGLPIVALATTEMATVVRQGETGFADTDWRALVPHMRRLLDDPAEARRLGANARAYARERFGIERFVRDWNAAFEEAMAMGG
jgi:hypothetical protein